MFYKQKYIYSVDTQIVLIDQRMEKKKKGSMPIPLLLSHLLN